MDFNDLKYKLEENKSKVMLVGAVVVFILTAIGVMKMLGIEFDYGVKSGGSESKKYVLATGIIGGNTNGEVKMYSPKTGKVVDTIRLDGESFMYDKGQDMKIVGAYNPQTGSFYEIKAKGKKLSSSSKGDIKVKGKSVLNFEYYKNHFVGLLSDEVSFVYKNLATGKEKVLDLKLDDTIDTYQIVDGCVVFTAGNYIHSVNLSTGKDNKIDIGESSSSISVVDTDKVLIHNNFGYDRNKSILIDVNPKTLYINKVYQFKNSKVGMLEMNSKTEKIYYNEESLTSKNGKTKQSIKSMKNDMSSPVPLIKHDSKYSMSDLNTYGSLGYIYYHEVDKLKIFNLKSMENEYTLNLIDDFYMPIY